MVDASHREHGGSMARAILDVEEKSFYGGIHSWLGYDFPPNLHFPPN